MSNAEIESHDVTLKDLNVLVSIATTGSFRAAAARLYTTQPAVTRSIARLEKAIGVRLFERGPRGAVLTGEGQTVLERARRVLGLVSEMRTDATSPDTRLVRFGAAATAAGSFLAPFLAQWIPSHPHVRLRMLEDGAARLRHRLEAGECDIAMIAAPVPATFDAGLITRIGVRAHFPENHPLAHTTEPVTLAELARHPLLVNDRPFVSMTLLFDAMESAGIQAQIIYQSSIGRTLAILAEAGLGVAVFGDSVDLRGMRLASRPVTADGVNQLGFELHVAWRRDGTPQWIRELGHDMSRFSQARRLPAG